MSNTHRTTRTQNSRESHKSEREDEQEAPQEVDQEQEPESEARPRKPRRSPRPSSDGEESTHEPEGRRPPLMEVLRQARGQLAELTGLDIALHRERLGG